MQKLFQPTLYKGFNDDIIYPPNKDLLLTKSDIYEKIQASEEEINEILKSINILEINGYIRMLDIEYMYEAYKEIIDTIIENKWDIELTYPLDFIYDIIYQSNKDDQLIYFLLKTLGKIDSKNNWRMNINEISKVIAHILFRERIKTNSTDVKKYFIFISSYTIF